jgi:hypothetical protein
MSDPTPPIGVATVLDRLRALEIRVAVLETQVRDIQRLLWWVIGLVTAGGVATNVHLSLLPPLR